MTKHAALRYPDRKISETFLEFAGPIVRDLPSEAPEHRARQALQVAFTVWNAVIFADVLKDHAYIDQIRHITVGNPEARLLVEQMIVRKRELFADDQRMIGDWEVTRTEEGINVRADARDPYSLARNLTSGRNGEPT